MREHEAFRLVFWRGTLMTRAAYEVVRTLSPEKRQEILDTFSLFWLANEQPPKDVNGT